MTGEHDPALLAVSPDGRVRLGAGLTRLGRPWGVRRAPVPSEEEARKFLACALALGVRTFDTAPSYGSSEARLGAFLTSLGPEARAVAFIATKFGEQWNPDTGDVAVDHSYDALARSLEASLHRLGAIDLVQLHRTTPDALRSTGVRRAFALARTSGVAALGASVTRVDDARLALDLLGVEWLQFPYHLGNANMEEAFELADEYGARILVNRPFGMGALVTGAAGSSDDVAEAAFRFILEREFSGAILTGTASPAHLRWNLAAFARAVARATGSGGP